MRDSGQPARSRHHQAIGLVAALGGLVLTMVILAAPFSAHGKPGPVRGEVPAGDAEPTSLARAFQPVAGNRETGETGPDGDSVRPRFAADPIDASTGRRPRPDPAPVSLAPPATEVAPEPAPVEARSRRRAAPSRVWPLQAGAFQMSQPFGCVPQLGGYYPVVAGCPPDAPAVHSGLDLAAAEGTPIFAAAAGWVTKAGPDRAGGVANTQIVIQHDGANDGYATEYYHWIRTYVAPGDYVQAGDVIAEVGSVGYSTGPHLHFSVVDFARNERIDPVGWLPASPESDAYLGRTPERAPISFAGVNVPTPDYADPAPPPVPNEQAVPSAAPATAPEPASAGAEPTPNAAPAQPESVPPTAEPAAPTPVPTAHADRAGAAGSSETAEDKPKRKRQDEAEATTAEPTVQVPPAIPPVPANPMVTTPAPAGDAGDDDTGNGKQKKRNR